MSPRVKETATSSADLNLRIVRHLVRYLVDHHRPAEIEAIAKAGGVSAAELLTGTGWVSLAQFEALLARSRALMPDDETFIEACAYKFDAVSGPVKFMLSALTPVAAYKSAPKNMPLVTAISSYHTEVVARSHIRMTYRTTKKESRLMCLSRQALIARCPSIWGLPLAHLKELSCVARGEECCLYDIRVYEARRWTPLAIGAALAALGGFVIQHSLLAPVLWWWFALIGAFLGFVYELRRSGLANRKTQEEINAEYLQTARDEANARKELFALTQRQRAWSQLMEHQIVDRDGVMQQVAIELSQLHSDRLVRLRGGARELGSPISQIRASVAGLRSESRTPGTAEPLLQEIENQVALMDRKLKALAGMASPGSDLIELMPRRIPVAPLVDDLRNRIRGLVHSRDVRVSVFAVREAPPALNVDEMLFNGVVDNLLENAANHTEQGSIVVEISGTPGFLTIKVSDTGGGVSEGEIDTLFRPLRNRIGGFSFGTGLPVVVELLARIGGKLEVMTQRDRGTTLWAHFPVESPAIDESSEPSLTGGPEELDQLVDKVVSIRRFSEG